MRRRRCNGRGLLIGVLLAAAAPAAAQSATGTEAAEFQLPTGARSLAMGQAAAAAAIGSDAIWWNPALIARGPREVALHLVKTFTIETDAMAAVVVPFQGIGTLALSARYLNEGQQDATDEQGNIVGTGSIATVIAAATFAAPFGNRFAAGITAKLLHSAFSCTGSCADAHSSQTGALDLGAHYLVTADSTFSIGAAIRSIGFRLQVQDSPQADPLPARGDLGVLYAPKLAQLPPEARIRVAADVVTDLVNHTSGVRIGGELSWQNRYEGRIGYVQNAPTGSGLTFGAGFSTGKLQIDFAQMLSDIASQSGSTPTFLTLRYIF
jgi:hypothetical protein